MCRGKTVWIEKFFYDPEIGDIGKTYYEVSKRRCEGCIFLRMTVSPNDPIMVCGKRNLTVEEKDVY